MLELGIPICTAAGCLPSSTGRGTNHTIVGYLVPQICVPEERGEPYLGNPQVIELCLCHLLKKGSMVPRRHRAEGLKRLLLEFSEDEVQT